MRYKHFVKKTLCISFLILLGCVSLTTFFWLFYEYYDQLEIADGSKTKADSWLDKDHCMDAREEAYYLEFLPEGGCRPARSVKKQNIYYIALKNTLTIGWRIGIMPISNKVGQIWGSVQWIMWILIVTMAVFGTLFIFAYFKDLIGKPNIHYINMGGGSKKGKKIKKRKDPWYHDQETVVSNAPSGYTQI